MRIKSENSAKLHNNNDSPEDLTVVYTLKKTEYCSQLCEK